MENKKRNPLKLIFLFFLGERERENEGWVEQVRVGGDREVDRFR